MFSVYFVSIGRKRGQDLPTRRWRVWLPENSVDSIDWFRGWVKNYFGVELAKWAY